MLWTWHDQVCSISAGQAPCSAKQICTATAVNAVCRPDGADLGGPHLGQRSNDRQDAIDGTPRGGGSRVGAGSKSSRRALRRAGVIHKMRMLASDEGLLCVCRQNCVLTARPNGR